MGRARYLTLQLLIILLILGCSGGNNPTIPFPSTAPQGDIPASAEREANGVTACIELMQVSINKNTGAMELIPLRGAQLALNVLSLLEPPAGKYLKLDWNTLIIDPGADYIGVDVILTHPILFPFFRGFDVRGVVFGPDVTNADGYTTFLNPDDFTGVQYGYKNGLIGTPDEVAQFDNAFDLWGYKYFCDGLGLKDDLAGFFSDPANIANRGTFSPGKINRRHYDLQFGAAPGDFLIFNYAILASFHGPTGTKPWDIDDFEITSCNAAEAFLCSTNIIENSLFYRAEEARGGSLNLDLRIGDWQGFSNYDVKLQFADAIGTTLHSTSHEPSGLPHIEIFHFKNINLDLNKSGDIPFLVTATDLTTTFGQSWFQSLLPKDNPRYNDYVYTCWKSTIPVSNNIPFNPVDITPDYFRPMHAEDIVVKDGIAYIAASNLGLITIDVTDPAEPTWLGSFNDTLNPRALDVSGNYAYLVCSPSVGLAVIDIKDPAHPLLVGSNPDIKCYSNIAVQGNYAYLPSNKASGGLIVADISDPSFPVEVAFLELLYPYNICVNGQLAYLTAQNGFNIIDITDPTHPAIIGNTPTTGTDNKLDVVGGFAFLVGGQRLQIIDISDPKTPLLKGFIDIPFAYLQAIKVRESYAYIASDRSALADDFGLYIVDITDPDNPQIIAKRCIPSNADFIFLCENIAFLTFKYSGLYCVDISDPFNSELLGTFLVPGQVWDVDFCMDTLVIANGECGLLMVDVNQPASPDVIGFFDGQDDFRQLATSQNLVYTYGYCGPFMVLDCSSPGNPVLLGTCQLSNAPYSVSTFQDYEYLPYNGGGVYIINVGNPTAPFIVNDYLPSEPIRRILFDGDIAYGVVFLKSLLIYDIGNPEAPLYLGSYTPKYELHDVEVLENIAYTTQEGVFTGYLIIVDLSNPGNPVQLSSLGLGGVGYICLKYGYIFLSKGKILHIIDVSNPKIPHEIGSWNLTLEDETVIKGNMAYGGQGIIQLW